MSGRSRRPPIHANASKEIKNPVQLYARPFLKDCLRASAEQPGNTGSTWGLWGLEMDIRTKAGLYIVPRGRPLVQNSDLDVYIRDKMYYLSRVEGIW